MNRVKHFFNSIDVDSLVLFNGDAAREFDANFFYFAGFELDNSILLLKRDERLLLVSELNFELAKEKFDGRIEKFERGKAWEKAGECLEKEKKVGLNYEFVSLRSWKKMRGMRGKAVDVSKQLLELRAAKEERELNEIRKATRITKKILGGMEGAIKVGRTEKQVVKELKMNALELNAETAFEPIVSFGGNTRFPHSKPTNKKLERGEHALIDFGVRTNGYCSDFTRCYFLSENREAEKAYEKLREIVSEIVCFIRPNIRVSEVAEYANELFVEAKLPKMIHSLGHGIGLQVHESPRINLKSKDVFRKGMAFALEPAVYTKKFGVRLEEDFRLEKSAALL